MERFRFYFQLRQGNERHFQ